MIWRQNIQSASLSWEKNGRPDSNLLTDSGIMEAQKWLHSRPDDLSSAEARYLKASLAVREQKFKQRRLQIVGMVLGAVILAFVIIYVFRQNQQQNNLEARSRQLASNSETLIAFQPELSLLLAVEAVRSAPTSEAQQALKTVLLQTHLQTVIRVGAPVYSARYSHDGKRFVTGNGGGISIAQVWQPGGDNSWQNLITLRGHLGDVRAVAFSPDDKLIATASYDSTTILWDAASGEMLGPRPESYPASFTDIDWSPDGTLVAASAQDNQVYVWDTKSKKLIQTLKLFTDNVNSAAFSPDGQFLAAGSKDTQVRVWNTKTWDEATIILKGPLKGHTGEVLSVRFSADSKFLVTAGSDNMARVWETSQWRTVQVLSGHTNSVRRASFSPDGKFIVTASDDNTAIVWEFGTGKRAAILRGSLGSVNDASFSADGKLILTASDDGTARLWELSPQVNPNSSIQELLSLACTKVTRNMTNEEWRQYMGSESYRLTCLDIPQHPTPTPTPIPSPSTQPSVAPKKS